MAACLHCALQAAISEFYNEHGEKDAEGTHMPIRDTIEDLALVLADFIAMVPPAEWEETAQFTVKTLVEVLPERRDFIQASGVIETDKTGMH